MGRLNSNSDRKGLSCRRLPSSSSLTSRMKLRDHSNRKTLPLY